MSIQESGEMYLETILILSRKEEIVRSIDVGTYMGYSKPSVSRALGILRKNGYLESNEQGHLSLTPTGLAIAEKIYERHTLLTSLLVSLGVDPQTASEDACKMEHAISDDSLAAIKSHFQKHVQG